MNQQHLGTLLLCFSKSWGKPRLLSHKLAELSSWIETEKHEAVRPVVPYKALSPPTWLAKKPAAAAQRSTFSTFHTLEVTVLVPSWLQSIVSFIALQVCMMFVTAISSKTGLLVESTSRETRSNIAAIISCSNPAVCKLSPPPPNSAFIILLEIAAERRKNDASRV